MVFFLFGQLSTSQLEGAQGGAVASVPDPLPDTFKSLSLARLTEKRWTADLTKRWTQRDGHPRWTAELPSGEAAARGSAGWPNDSAAAAAAAAAGGEHVAYIERRGGKQGSQRGCLPPPI